MIEDQYPVISASSSRDTNFVARLASSRILRCILIGIGVTLVLTGVELAILALASALHLFDRGGTSHLSVTQLLSQHTSLLLLVALAELLIITITLLLTDKSFELLVYLKDVQKAQERYCSVYTTLPSLVEMYETPVVYYQHTPDPSVFPQVQNLSIHELLRKQDGNQFLLGAPGSGKTLALHRYQYIITQSSRTVVRQPRKVPIYVPLKDYSLFLKMHQQTNTVPALEEDVEEQSMSSSPSAVRVRTPQMVPATDTQQVTLLDFLRESDLEGIHHLRPYLKKLMEQGRLTFLCDGFHKVDHAFQASVAAELALLMLETQNQVVVTCHEEDYYNQRDFAMVGNNGQAAVALIPPLQPPVIREFVERYVEQNSQDRKAGRSGYPQRASLQSRSNPTAGQIRQAIEQSRLRDLCSNPMLLFLFLEIVDKSGLDRAKRNDTRSRLLREYVQLLIEHGRQHPRWGQQAPARADVLRFLSELAFAAREADETYAIQLPISLGTQSEALRIWLEEHPATTDSSPFLEPMVELYDHNELAQLLLFAQSATLVSVSSRGVLSFRHELIAQYLVAHYFLLADGGKQSSPLPIGEEILGDVTRWCEPIMLWAGLVDAPLQLAERFTVLGRSNPSYFLPALMLSLVCIGVAGVSPQAQTTRPLNAPTKSTLEALAIVIRDKAGREELAHLFTRCAQESGQDIYRSLLPLLGIEGIDEFLLLLNTALVCDLFFSHLCAIIDIVAYETQVKRLIRVLGRLEAIGVAQATELSRSVPGRTIRLRAAAINILGGTNVPEAVEPLIAHLSDTDPFIVERAVHALRRLGPGLTLPRLLEGLENRTPTLFTQQVHRSVLLILARYLDEQDAGRQLTEGQQKRIIAALIAVLASNYTSESAVQQQATAILVRQGQAVGGTPDATSTLTIAQLISSLSSNDEMMVRNVVHILQEIGAPATHQLLEQLNRQPSERVRMRIVEVLRDLRDPEALESILRLVDDPSQLVQQQVTSALHAYASESIPGLIDMVLTAESEPAAERAAQVLADMGEEVVMPVIEALSSIVPGRTRLLVRVLEYIHDPRCIPALITLLWLSQEGDTLLTVAIVHALGRFPDERVVQPLIAALANSTPQIYEEAIDALSQLGTVALDGLIAALNVQQETPTTSRVCRALLGMVPFPGEQLIDALVACSDDSQRDGQAQQIMAVFHLQGAEAAQVLVRHLFHENAYARGYIHRTLREMEGPVAVPALLEALGQPSWHNVIADFLLKYPEAMSPLVNLLGDPDRHDAAADILIQFGSAVLKPLVSAMDDSKNEVQEVAWHIIVTLVRQQPDTLVDVVSLFYPPLPMRAHELLLDILTNDLVDLSLPDLLEGLADAHLVAHVSQALLRLVQKPDMQPVVLRGLLDALRIEELRRGAMTTLVQIGEPAVQGVGSLVIDQDKAVAKAAQDILCEIGPAAFSFIWAAHSDTGNPARREAALKIFHAMDTEVIKDELVILLEGNKPEDLSMALALLLECIHEEGKKPYSEQEMIPLLLRHVQAHGGERASLRIITLLLLLGGDEVIDHMLDALYDHPGHQQQLVYAFLLLGGDAEVALLDVFNDLNVSPQVRAEVVSILGMLAPYPEVAEHAQMLSNYGIGTKQTSPLYPDQLSISLRALGGLLAGGHWDVATLQDLRRTTRPDSPAGELYHILLGGLFGPSFVSIEEELQRERDARKADVQNFSLRIMADQQHIQELEDQLEQVQHEHETRSDELHQTTQEKEALLARIEQVARERQALRTNLDQAIQEKEVYRDMLERTEQEKTALEDQIRQLKWQLSRLGSDES